VGKKGRFFVADRNNHRIQSFERDGSFVRAWGQLGSRVGEFREPHDVAADDEFVYVADLWNQRVQAFDPDGQPMFTITGAPSLSSPRGLAVHDRKIYVAEAAGGRVSVYDRDGKLVTAYGTAGGDELGHLIEPVDVAVAPNGDVWVVNSGNNRLERFAADGRAIGSIPVPGWTGVRLKEVYLAIGPDGRCTSAIGTPMPCAASAPTAPSWRRFGTAIQETVRRGGRRRPPARRLARRRRRATSCRWTASRSDLRSRRFV
jgi:DNA-binding beta-propeller fold protein YncE